MSVIKNLGVVKIKYNSGISETNKGAKYPYSNCEIGDIMLDIDGKRLIVSPEVYNKEYKADVVKCEKAQKAADEKARVAKEQKEELAAQDDQTKDEIIAAKDNELEVAKKMIQKLQDEKEEAEAQNAEKLLAEIEADEKEKDEDEKDA